MAQSPRQVCYAIMEGARLDVFDLAFQANGDPRAFSMVLVAGLRTIEEAAEPEVEAGVRSALWMCAFSQIRAAGDEPGGQLKYEAAAAHLDAGEVQEAEKLARESLVEVLESEEPGPAVGDRAALLARTLLAQLKREPALEVALEARIWETAHNLLRPPQDSECLWRLLFEIMGDKAKKLYPDDPTPAP
ncbi:MAG: hypothetical protein L6Q38_18350 [Nitrospira sp.]|nr:hypothetical protein [Nitrospira sp.]